MQNKTLPLASAAAPKTYVCEYSNDGRRITAPGKFEGEPVFAPHYWDMGLEGFADSDNGTVYGFRFKRGELADPATPFGKELKAWLGRKTSFRLREDGNGFVHCF